MFEMWRSSHFTSSQFDSLHVVPTSTLVLMSNLTLLLLLRELLHLCSKWSFNERVTKRQDMSLHYNSSRSWNNNYTVKIFTMSQQFPSSSFLSFISMLTYISIILLWNYITFSFSKGCISCLSALSERDVCLCISYNVFDSSRFSSYSPQCS